MGGEGGEGGWNEEDYRSDGARSGGSRGEGDDFTRALPHARRICMVMICDAAGSIGLVVVNGQGAERGLEGRARGCWNAVGILRAGFECRG